MPEFEIEIILTYRHVAACQEMLFSNSPVENVGYKGVSVLEHHTVKTHGGVQMERHSFLPSAVGRGGWSASRYV
jgi:hypothetical protein